MTSLFSSFDLWIFSGIFLPFLGASSLGILSKYWFKSYFQFAWANFQKFLTEFLSSLTNSNFSKGLSCLILSLMVFVFFLNFSSIFPFIFPLTSQMSIVLSMSVVGWLSLMFLSFSKNLKSQILHFIPEGAPLGLSFVLLVIEIVSSLIRPVTLTVRLVANILAGHLLVVLLSLLAQNFYFSFPFLSFLNLVELFVSLIQSYIFITLLSLYYSEI